MRRSACRSRLRRPGCALLLCCLFFFFSALPAAAAAPGHVTAADFSWRGITLGDSRQQLFASWGEPLYDKAVSLLGKDYELEEYDPDTQVLVEKDSGRIVEITVKDRDFVRTHEGKEIRRGATPYYLQRVYGKTARRPLGSGACYAYPHPAHPDWHLILVLDGREGSLSAFRLTALPFGDDEEGWAP